MTDEQLDSMGRNRRQYDSGVKHLSALTGSLVERIENNVLHNRFCNKIHDYLKTKQAKN